MQKLSHICFTAHERAMIRNAVRHSHDMKAAFTFLRWESKRGAYVIQACLSLARLTG